MARTSGWPSEGAWPLLCPPMVPYKDQLGPRLSRAQKSARSQAPGMRVRSGGTEAWDEAERPEQPPPWGLRRCQAGWTGGPGGWGKAKLVTPYS